ncbi:MAG: hypothetical protein ACFE91_04065 [Promethearchaeota archaeon]
MGFGKAFLLSIAAFVGLNFIFTIINYAIGAGFNDLFTTIQNYPLMIIYYLFGSIISLPSLNLNYAIAEPFLNNNMDLLILGIGYLIAPIIAAILAGRFGENKGQSFGGWLLTTIISTTSIIIAVFLSNFTEITILTLYGLLSFDQLLIFVIISCVVNLVFYGFFALLFSKIEYY